MTAPEGMIGAEKFAKSKGYSLDETIGMIRSGFYDGRLVDGQWYVREKSTSEDRKPYSPTSPQIDDSHPTTLTKSVGVGATTILRLMAWVHLVAAGIGAIAIWSTMAYVQKYPDIEAIKTMHLPGVAYTVLCLLWGILGTAFLLVVANMADDLQKIRTDLSSS
jgi:hypothetical protein